VSEWLVVCMYVYIPSQDSRNSRYLRNTKLCCARYGLAKWEDKELVIITSYEVAYIEEVGLRHVIPF